MEHKARRSRQRPQARTPVRLEPQGRPCLVPALPPLPVQLPQAPWQQGGGEKRDRRDVGGSLAPRQPPGSSSAVTGRTSSGSWQGVGEWGGGAGGRDEEDRLSQGQAGPPRKQGTCPAPCFRTCSLPGASAGHHGPLGPRQQEGLPASSAPHPAWRRTQGRRGLAVVMGHHGCRTEHPPSSAAPAHRAGGDLTFMLGSDP